MKNLFKGGVMIVAILATMCMFASCNRDEVVPAPVEEAFVEFSDKDMINYLSKKFGFSETDIQNFDSIFVAEGDIVFFKSDIQSALSQSALKAHYRTTYQVTATTSIPVNIYNIRVSGLMVLSWRQAVEQAVKNWNSLSGGISFYIVDAPATYLNGIDVSIGSLSDPNAVAWAAFPTSNGKPGSQVIISSSKWSDSSITSSMKQMAMVHELGHTIGFAHTDGGSGTYIPTTCGTGTDPNSVMRSTMTSWTGFTNCDKQAFSFLY